MTDDEKNKPWSALDFLGKYHKSRIRARYPIIGTAVASDLARETRRVEREAELEDALRTIANKYGTNVRPKILQATREWGMRVEQRVGGTLAKVGQVLDELESEFALVAGTAEEAKEVPVEEPPGDGEYEGEHEVYEISDAEAAASAAAAALEAETARRVDASWWTHVLRLDVDGVETMLKAGYMRIDAPKPHSHAEHYGCGRAYQTQGARHSPLHVAVRAGEVEMVQVLLYYGANPDVANEFGDAPVLLSWVFWHPSHATLRETLRDDETRQKALKHEETTVAILVALLSHGARVDAKRSDGSTALHEAARKGPARAVRTLLLYGADHLQCDNQGETPVGIAVDRLEKEKRDAMLSDGRRKRPRDDVDEIAHLLSRWTRVKEEQKFDEFLQQWWNWMAKDDHTLHEGLSANRIIESTQLDLAQRQLALALKTRKYGMPYWTYDAVRRTVCCPQRQHRHQALAELQEHLQDDDHPLIPGGHNSAPPFLPTNENTKRRRRRRRPREGRNEQQSCTPFARRRARERPASETEPLSVPLDKYLLLEVKPPFVETLEDKGHRAVRSERDNVLARMKEKDAARRREKRERHRLQRLIGKKGLFPAEEDPSHSSSLFSGHSRWSSSLSSRRALAARAICNDGLNEGSYERSAMSSSLLHQATKPTPATMGGVVAINEINAQLANLEAYARATDERQRVAASNPLARARANIERRIKGSRGSEEVDDEPLGLDRGARNRRAGARARERNDATHLPPAPPSVDDNIRDENRVTSISERAHQAFPWEYHDPGDENGPDSDYLGPTRPNNRAIVPTTQFACDLQQRPQYHRELIAL
ncbi:hypothetical protein CTAYLR_005001 [Chrysophaeum taylorii]|uniref:Uncharacterized protein n=1 Tax=Chrysophaeum taylorii TaxID=2483200 RepID=A0AAD7XHA0_9STRA|nr:hypothetical protein CTAYLR_005001 [Chrysophaeum taylorii]